MVADLLSKARSSLPEIVHKARSLPEIVHQIWFNFREWGTVQGVPSKYDAQRESWLKWNPDWKQVVWNESTATQLLSRFYPLWLKKFNAFSLPIERADFFRWVALYHFGGCYADTDCKCIAPLDLQKRYAHTKGKDLLVVPDSTWAMNAMIISTARHPAVRRLIDAMTPNTSWMATYSVVGLFFTTGPAFVRQQLSREVNKNGDVLLDPDLMWHAPGQSEARPTTRPFLAHHAGDGSWNFNQFLALDILKLILFALCFLLLVVGVAYLALR